MVFEKGRPGILEMLRLVSCSGEIAHVRMFLTSVLDRCSYNMVSLYHSYGVRHNVLKKFSTFRLFDFWETTSIN